MNQLKQIKSIDDDDGSGRSNINGVMQSNAINIISPNSKISTSSSYDSILQSKEQLKQSQQQQQQHSVNKMKRKSLILCDIKNLTIDDNDYINNEDQNINNDDDDNINNHDNNDIDDDNDDDDDDELICNSILVTDNQCCDNTMKILNKNNKSKNCNNILLNNCNNHFNLNNKNKLNQHQIEYDSQGEEEGFIDSSMESAIEIKDCCENQTKLNKNQNKKSTSPSSSGLNNKIIKNKTSPKTPITTTNTTTTPTTTKKLKNQKYNNYKNNIDINNDSDNDDINHDNENDVIDIDTNDTDDEDDDHHHHHNNIEQNYKKNNLKSMKILKNNNCNNIKNNFNLKNNIFIKNNNINNKNSNNSGNNIIKNNKSNNIINNDNDSDDCIKNKNANDLISNCCNRDGCISLKDILGAFNAPISEEQAWALIFQTVKLYRDSITNSITNGLRCCKVNVPNNLDNLNIHLDGSVHVNYKKLNAGDSSAVTSHKKILHKIGHVIFLALDYNLQADEDCIMSSQLEHLISQMTTIDDIDDEGIERDSEDCEDLDDIIEACIPRVQPSVPEDHYKAVCRAFATEAQDLRIFLQKVFHGDTQALRIKADAVDSNQELDKLGFNDWARFWMQVVDELRQGVRLKRRDFRDVTRTPVEYELTPYEILMEDIRAKKYNLRKVMVNGDIPPRVKKDAHAVILEFIRSRPPLKKASERKLPPPVKRNPSPREQLMDSIRKGRPLKPVPSPTLKNRLLPSTSQQHQQQQQHESLRRDDKSSTSISASSSSILTNNMTCSSSTNSTTAGSSSRSVTKHIQKSNNKIDLPHMMHDSYSNVDETDYNRSNPSTQQHQHRQNQHQQQQLNNFSQPKMPAYPITGYTTNKETNSSNKTVIRRTTYDLATQCESRRASMRRHTIVGCQSSVLHNETQSVPPSRPDSRQSSCHQQQQQQQQHQQITNNKYPNQSSLSIAAVSTGSASTSSSSSSSSGTLKYQTKSNQSCEPTPTISTTNLSNTAESFTKNHDLDETSSQWMDKNTSDRLSLTLEEIVHIRSVMTKAELEGLPVGVRVKEEVEKRKICFLCLRTRFTIFVWGIQCKLCQRTVCSKCYSKMRIPTEHFRNVPVVLLSPSLIGSPASSSAASPCHHGSISHPNSSIDETFPKTLMERLMRSESNRKARNSVGSAPSSPKNQRSNMSTPGVVATGHHNSNDLMTKSSDSHTLLSNGYNKENAGTTLINGGIAANRQVAGVMSRSMEGPRSLPMQSPGRAHSNCSTLDRKNRFARALTLSSSSSHGAVDLKENLRGEMMAVCNDCRDLVLEIIRSSRQTRSSARNQALKNLTLDISPVYK